MHIEINPRSLKNLEQICEILYKLHPSVLQYMIDNLIEDIGCIIGCNDGKNYTFEQREKLTSFNAAEIIKEKQKEIIEEDNKEDNKEDEEDNKEVNKEDNITYLITDEDNKKENEEEDEDEIPFKEIINIMHGDGEYPEDIFVFNRLLKYLQHDTYEYIPIKIYIEVEDPVIGKKIKKLVSFLEKTDAPEQFYLHKREEDSYAYFAEGYGLTMNEEQEKKQEDLYSKHDFQKLKKLLIKEKLYYY